MEFAKAFFFFHVPRRLGVLRGCETGAFDERDLISLDLARRPMASLVAWFSSPRDFTFIFPTSTKEVFCAFSFFSFFF